MDLARSEFLPPVLLRDMHREARQQTVVAQSGALRDRRTPALRERLGTALVAIGCRTQAAGAVLRLASASPFASPAPCGCGA